MSILRELNTILDTLGVTVETGVFKGKAPDEYAVITPMTDTFEVFADNRPQYETQVLMSIKKTASDIIENPAKIRAK